MPVEIWNSAVAMARMYGVCKIARAVGLDYKSLRTRVAKAMEQPGLIKPTFVQLPAIVAHAEMAPIPSAGAIHGVPRCLQPGVRWGAPRTGIPS
jgi:hypothetical protein